MATVGEVFGVITTALGCAALTACGIILGAV